MQRRSLRLLGCTGLLAALVLVMGAGDAANTPQYTKEGKLMRGMTENHQALDRIIRERICRHLGRHRNDFATTTVSAIEIMDRAVPQIPVFPL